jgi:uncharacterized protein YdeI (YjbR/CyaY-like superfamily)
MEKIPTDFRKALAASPKVAALWSDLTPIARRDFVSWIEEAKHVETRARRIKVACSKLAAGKRRPCCYAIVPMNLYKALSATPKAKAVWSTLTPDERRDMVRWIQAVKESEARGLRILQACALLATGKRHP